MREAKEDRGKCNLEEVVVNWLTPNAQLAISAPNNTQTSIAIAVANWGTPRDRDYKSSKGTGKHHRQQLGRQVHQTSIHGEESSQNGPNSNPLWRTPQSQEPQINSELLTGKDGHRKYHKETGRLAQYSITQQVGETQAKKLNPLFVEWLMGLPLGWSDYRALVTPLSPWLQRWRSLLYGED
jgi:hypothetical protein